MMDGKRIRGLFSNEIKNLLGSYQQFEILLPATAKHGAQHPAEDGRYVEMVLAQCLKKFLPKELDVVTGFILRPAVKTGTNDRQRNDGKDKSSGQLDIIVYDSSKYPVFLRMGDHAIVPPEGVIAVISVKKILHDRDIENEIEALSSVTELCNDNLRKPFLALISMQSGINKKDTGKWIYNKVNSFYQKNKPSFDDVIGYIGALNGWSFFKKRPTRDQKNATFIYTEHEKEEEYLGISFLLTGIFSVFYDSTRSFTKRPGFTAFAGKKMREFDAIPCK